HNTNLPWSSAGNTFSIRCCLRAAAKRSASVRASISVWVASRMICRIFSAISIPPGSRVTSTSYPFASSFEASDGKMVVFPAPSPPSNVIKCPFTYLLSLLQKHLSYLFDSLSVWRYHFQETASFVEDDAWSCVLLLTKSVFPGDMG